VVQNVQSGSHKFEEQLLHNYSNVLSVLFLILGKHSKEKGAQSFSKKVWHPLNFIEKWVKNKSQQIFFVVI
jgi:hypothetical protein